MTDAIKINASLCFTQGFAYRTCEKMTAEAMRTTDAARQRIAINEVKAGIMAAILKPTAQPDAELAAYVSGVLNKSGKERTDAERKAETAARTKVARLLARYGVPNLDKRGGAGNAKKRGTKNKSAPARKVETKKAAAKTVLATYVSPDIKAASDWGNHLAFVTKNLGLTMRKAEPFLTEKQKSAMRKALARFSNDMKKIMSA